MAGLSRGEMIRIAIEQYFSQISKDTIEETLAFFQQDATFTLYPSGRIFSGHAEIAAMYGEVFARHERIEREIIDVAADPETGTLSASFRATAYPAGSQPVVMHNVNFWRFDGRKFAWVKVYTTGPSL